MNQISKARVEKFSAQNGLCHYCKQPMWERDPHEFAERFALNDRRLNWLRSTAEHLHARCDGGKDTKNNIVAACRFCNAHRHHACKALPPEAYGQHVRKRLAAGKWHGLHLRPLC
ncbi:MAG: hypothetical protein J0I80_12095 [Sphingomonas sp.]|nr:hypothetical protein [Sphingomonas sp.]